MRVLLLKRFRVAAVVAMLVGALTLLFTFGRWPAAVWAAGCWWVSMLVLVRYPVGERDVSGLEALGFRPPAQRERDAPQPALGRGARASFAAVLLALFVPFAFFVLKPLVAS